MFIYKLLDNIAKLIPIKVIRSNLRNYIGTLEFESNRIPKNIKCKIGRNVYFGKNIDIQSQETEIGNFVSIASNVIIGPSEHPLNFISTSPYLYVESLGYKKHIGNYEILNPCKIGNDVWIASNVFIKNGITVGDGAVIAAGAVVTKDVPPYAIIGGVPAKIIKYRFDKETIKQLLELKWWDLPDDIIKDMPYKDVQQTIEYLKKYKECEIND